MAVGNFNPKTIIPSGTDGYVLVADSSEVTGLKWLELNEFIEATSTTGVTAAASNNLAYTQATITLTPGVWLVEAGCSLTQAATTDSESVGIYNVTTSAEVSNSRGLSTSNTTTTKAGVYSRVIKITVTSNTDFCPFACRNGGSTVRVEGSGNAGGIAGFIRGVRIG